MEMNLNASGEDTCYDVSFEKLGADSFRWCHLRAYDQANYQFTEHGVKLRGNHFTLDDVDAPTFLGLAQADGGSRAELRLTTGDAQCVKASVSLEQGQQEVKLHVESDEEIYTFFAEIAGERKELGKARTKYLSSEVAGGFTGTVMAMYAVNPEEKEDAWGEFTGLNWTMKKWVDNV